MRTLLAIALALLALLASLLLFGLFQFDAMDAVLKAFGKDSTLTGRTFLWAIAERTMAEHPWTGVGANGFWRPELGAANEITRFFYYDQFVKFSFHNSYYENGVQLGYPGYYATMFMAAWALFQTARTWLRNQTLLNAAFLILAVMVIIRANAEPDLGIEFGGTLVLLLIGALRKEDLRPRFWPPTPQPGPGVTTPATQPVQP
jgi:exopolysaccharide production protein ExoQ